jgi:glycerophosphoryl diester phosphodiesterase
MDGNNIYNPQDPFHQRIAKGERKINLLREVPASEGRRTGIFVEFEKKTSEN